MRRYLSAVLIAAIWSFPLLALAQTPAPAPVVPAPVVAPTSVLVPWGDWLATALTIINSLALPVIGGAVAWMFRALPSWAVNFFRTISVEQWLQRALDFGVNTTIGAVRGKSMTLNVGNEVVAKALSYIAEHAPEWLKSWLGGTEGIRDRLVARLQTSEGESMAKLASPKTMLGSAKETEPVTAPVRPDMR